MGQSLFWTPGSQIVYREVWQNKVWTARPVTVVQDTPQLIALYLCSGTHWKMPALPDQNADRADLFNHLLATGTWQLIDTTWTWGDTLLLIHPGEAHAIHVMWRDVDRAFTGWYINLQEPLRRTSIGFDFMDQELDIVVKPDLSGWVWKDEAGFRQAEAMGLLSRQEAQQIRTEAGRVLKRVRAKASPFNDDWENWVPDPDWSIPVLPDGWDIIQGGEMRMANKFLQQLDARPLLCDGAMGTMIYSKGIAFERCFDELNLTNPALVAEIHHAYIDAGADVIETNSFGANRLKLGEHGLAGKVSEINRTAAQLARRVVDASFKEVFVAGSIGPLGARLAPLGRVSAHEAHDAFQEQVAALIEGGVDLLLFETFADLRELREAIIAAREVSTDVPLVAQLTFTQDSRTPLGHTPQKVGEQVADLPVDVIGLNCSVGPADVLRTLQNLAHSLPDGTRLSAQPNAGWPERVGGRIMYPAPPEYFGDYALAFVEAGARLVGGCCGTTPEHITHMRAALDNPTRDVAHLLVSGAEAKLATSPDTVGPTRMAQQLATGEFIIGVEMSPPKGFSAERLLAGAATLQAAGADVINLADSPRARMRMSPWAVCHLIQHQLDLETVLHFPTRGRNILRVQGDLLAAHALNVRNIFVVMGDPTSIGEYPDALNEYDVVPSGLIKLLTKGFNQGLDYGGEPLLQPTNFLVGCAINLTPTDPERELKVLHRKIDSGATFALSQPIYDAVAAQSFVARYQEAYGPLKLHILAGVLPLYNARHAEFLHNEVPGINIPDEIRQRMRSAGDQGAAEGLALAHELIAGLRTFTHGIYLMPPFERFDLAARLIESVKQEIEVA